MVCFPDLTSQFLFQFENVVSFDVMNVIDDHFMSTLKDVLNAVGEIRSDVCFYNVVVIF